MTLVEVQRSHLPPLIVDEQPDPEYVLVDHISPLTRLQGMLGESGVNANEFFQTLKAVYGDELIGRVQQSGLTHNWPVNMQRRHCLETLAAVGHSVTLKDLNAMWAQLREMPADADVRKFLDIDSPTLNSVDRVEDLPPEQFKKLMRFLRNPIAFLEPFSSKTLWQEIAALPKTSDKKYMANTRYEESMERLFSVADRTKPEFSFGPHEHLAKFVAYAKPSTVQDGMIIPIYTNEKLVYYKLEAHINSRGLIAYLFTPIDGNPAHPAQLLFRGTNGMQSISRDMDVQGVGKAIFEKNAIDIQKMVEKAGVEKLDICGHSLGAADAQRAVASFVDHIVKNPESAQLKDIRLFAYCSPKLDVATVHQWKSNLKVLADRETPPHIELFFAEHENDLVTRSGDENLGTANARFIEANYLLVKSKSGAAKTELHHMTPFFQSGIFDHQTDGRTFLLFQDREMDKVLSQVSGFVEKQMAGPDEEGWKVLLTAEEALNAEEQAQAKEAEARLAILDREKAEIDASQKGAAQHSWLVWTASIFAQPIKLIVGAVTSVL